VQPLAVRDLLLPPLDLLRGHPRRVVPAFQLPPVQRAAVRDLVTPRTLVEVAVGGELEAPGAPAVLAVELGLEDGHDEAGHLVGGGQRLAAGLSVGDLALDRHDVLAQEGNALLHVIVGDAPRLEKEDEAAGGGLRRTDLVEALRETGTCR